MNARLTILAAALLATSSFAMADSKGKAYDMMKTDFVAKGQATADRINADSVQAICNRTKDKPSEKLAKRLEADQLAGVKYPADGKLLGDWQKGEKIAQSGKGMTWADKPDSENGGNCYNCHQIGPNEASYGTLGPSLFNFGKLRGNTPETQKYVYGKIYNAKAFNLCSAMPRLGHVGALKEAQIKDLVALLLDPASPVNK
jgi:sulfur-oxidizing protein SoxX